jgi:membrane protease YdiL (CAAX protease family)
LFEEITFRGVLQNYFSHLLEKWHSSKAGGASIAICTTSILFSLVHYPFGAAGFISRFIKGMLYGWLFYKTNSIWAPTIAHGTHNLIVPLH